MSLEMDEILIELVRMYEEVYDISNKKYSDSARKEKLWVQIGEELKNQVSSSFLLMRILKLNEIVRKLSPVARYMNEI